MKHYFKHIIILILLTSIAIISGCEGNALFSQLNTTDGLEVVFKGTYASNNPKPWDVVSMADAGIMVDDNSIDDIVGTTIGTIPSGEAIAPTKFYIDIAEMRLLTSSDYSKYLSGDELENEARFSTERYTSGTAGHDILDTDNFFNGTGISLPCQDIKPNVTYKYLLFYIRGLAFDGAYKFTPESGNGWDLTDVANSKAYLENYHVKVNGVFQKPSTAIEGFDFNQHSTLSSYDIRTTEYLSTNKVFPLVVEITNGLTYVPSRGKHTLEVRLVIKNFIKKYEFTDYSSSPSVNHFFALADWAMDVQSGDTTFGGNYHATAVSYAANTAGTITVNNVTDNRYVIVVPRDEPINTYRLDTASYNRNSLLGNYPSDPDTISSSYYDGTIFSQSSNMELILDYFLKKEIDRELWNVEALDLAGFSADYYDEYDSQWDTLYEKVTAFKVPLYAIYKTSTVNVIQNVAPGDYDVYYFTGSLPYGQLFDLLDSVSAVQQVSVTDADKNPSVTFP